MKEYNVTAFAYNDGWEEVYDCDIIEANDEAEALSVAKDILVYEAGYTAEEIEEFDLRVRERKD